MQARSGLAGPAGLLPIDASPGRASARNFPRILPKNDPCSTPTHMRQLSFPQLFATAKTVSALSAGGDGFWTTASSPVFLGETVRPHDLIDGHHKAAAGPFKQKIGSP